MAETDQTAFLDRARALVDELAGFEEDERISVINELRAMIHEHSPMADEPVDCIRWVPAEQVTGNSYNPNHVAPPEMRLLEHSITEDGYTQPIVAWQQPGDTDEAETTQQQYEVVDGFHRHLVGQRSDTVRERVRGYLPVVAINPWREADEDRMAATVRHNRARGQHGVEDMAQLVLEMYRKYKKDPMGRICQELGMDAEEANRLMMTGGLGEAYAHAGFSQAWDVAPLPLHEEGDRPA